MKESKIRIFLFSIVTVIVITILFSNIGQNFKTDINSYDDTMKYYKTLKSVSYGSKHYQDYINSASNYIAKILSLNKFEPLSKKGFLYQWVLNTPNFTHSSSLEVFNDRNELIKKYSYKKDFIEDFRGNITSGIVKSGATYEANIESIHNVLNEVLLFDGYKPNDSISSIANQDLKLKALGASGIISPMHTLTPSLESGYDDNELTIAPKGKGIAKFLVTQKVFDELKTFASKGYIIKINSGGEIIPTKFKNVYGVIKGKNPSFNPLIIGIFYDGPYKAAGDKYSAYKNYLIPSALSLDCLRVVNKQRLRKPDRTIIFAFLSGYSRNKAGLEELLKISKASNFLLLDGIGLKDYYNLDYGKSSSTFSSSVAYFLKKADFSINYRKKNTNLKNNLVITSVNDINSLREISVLNINRSNNSSHFVLSLIQDECYNLNFITGNIRSFRASLRFVRDHSAILSILAICCLVLGLFLPIKRTK